MRQRRLGVALAAFAGAAIYVSCKTPKTTTAGLKDTIPDGAQFAKVKLAMSADATTGEVIATFDATGSDLEPGSSLELVWDVLETKGTVNCSALKRTQQITLPEAGPGQVIFNVPKESLQVSIPISQMVAYPEDHPRNDKFITRRDRQTDGTLVVEGCLKTADGQMIGKGRGLPEDGISQLVKGNALRLQDGEEDPTLPVHIRFAERCAKAIGYIAPFSCIDNGQIAPITKEGVVQNAVSDKCDRPVYLEGPNRCGPATRVGRLKLYKDKQLTEERDDGTAVFFCRHYADAASLRIAANPEMAGPTYPGFADVAIIMQNSDTGKTCYFQALSRNPEDLYGRRVPPPSETDSEWETNTSAADKAGFGPVKAEPASTFWYAPREVARIHCVSCHDNDPFMHSPWIDQVRVLNGMGQPTDETMVPSEPFNEYKIIGAGFGFENWDTSYAFDTSEGSPLSSNKCLTCHRLSSMKTCRNWIEDAYPREGAANERDFYLVSIGQGNRLSDKAKSHPFHHWMPYQGSTPPPPTRAGPLQTWTNNLASYNASVEQLRTCCDLKMNGRPVLGYGQIGEPLRKTLSDAQLEFLKTNNCPVTKLSEVVER